MNKFPHVFDFYGPMRCDFKKYDESIFNRSNQKESWYDYVVIP